MRLEDRIKSLAGISDHAAQLVQRLCVSTSTSASSAQVPAAAAQTATVEALQTTIIQLQQELSLLRQELYNQTSTAVELDSVQLAALDKALRESFGSSDPTSLSSIYNRDYFLNYGPNTRVFIATILDSYFSSKKLESPTLWVKILMDDGEI